MKHFIISAVVLFLFQTGATQSISNPVIEFYTDASPLELHKDRKQMVMADMLNVRSEPNTRSEILGKIREGSVVNVTEYEEGNKFGKVMYADGTDVHIGYVSLDYLTPLYIHDGPYKAYANVNVVKKDDVYYQDLTLYEVTRAGRKEIYKSDGEMDLDIRLSYANAPDNDRIDRIITLRRNDYECCYCGSTITQIVQGTDTDLIIKDYRIEDDSEDIYRLHLANKWDQDEYDIALISGSMTDYNTNQLDSIKILEKYRLDRANAGVAQATNNNL